MKRKFTHWLRHRRSVDGVVFMRLALLLAVCMTSIGGWAEDQSKEFTFSGITAGNSVSVSDEASNLKVTVTSDESIAYDKNGYIKFGSTNSTPNYMKLEVANVSGSTATIESVTITYSSKDYIVSSTVTPTADPANSTITTATGSNPVTTWKSINSASASLTWGSENGTTQVSAHNSIRITKITVTYTTSGTATTKKDLALSFSASQLTCTAGETPTAPTLTVSDGTSALTSGYGTVTYTSSNSGVLPVNGSTGVLGAATTVTATTEVTITATAAANDTYNSASASYKVTVSPKSSSGKETTTGNAAFSYTWNGNGEKDWKNETKTENGVTVTLSNASNGSYFNISKSSSQTITVASSNGNLAKIELVFQKERNGSCVIGETTTTFSSPNTVTLDGDNGLSGQSATINIAETGGSGELHLTAIKVYLESATGDPTPTITFKQNGLTGTTEAIAETVELGSTPTAVSVSTNYGTLSLSGTDNGTGITYTESDGTVTFTNPTATGTYTLTASVAAVSGTCAGGTGTYTITVTKKQFDEVADQALDLTVGGSTVSLSSLGVNAFDGGEAVDGATVTWTVTSNNNNAITYDATAGTITPSAAGTATVTATIKDDDYEDKVVTVTITVASKQMLLDISKLYNKQVIIGGTLTLSKNDVTATSNVDGTSVTLTNVEFESQSTDYATIGNDNETVTGVALGTATIKVTASANGYDDATATFDITVGEGKLLTQTILVDDPIILEKTAGNVVKINGVMCDGKLLDEGDYTLTWDLGGNTSKFNISDDKTEVTTNGTGTSGVVTITAKIAATGNCAACTQAVNVIVYSSLPLSYLSFVQNADGEKVANQNKYTKSIGEKFTPTYYAVAKNIYVKEQGTATKKNVFSLVNPTIVYKVYENSTLRDLTSGDIVTVNEDGSITVNSNATENSTITLVGQIRKLQDTYKESDYGKPDDKCKIFITVKGTLPTPKITPASKIVTDSDFTNGNLNVAIAKSVEDENAKIYYTTDGTDPTSSSSEYSSSLSLKFTTSGEVKTVKAVVEKNGAYSTIAQENYTYLNGNNGAILDKEAYDAGDRIEKNDIVMTFGGVYSNTKDNAWDRMSGDKSGSLLGSKTSLAAYGLTNDNDAVIETATVTSDKADNTAMCNEYKHYKSSTATATYERVKNLPAYGNYFKFEPTKNGDLTVYVEQQGSINAKSVSGVDQNQYDVIRLRPLYFVDETGIAQEAKSAETTSKINSNWKSISPADFTDGTNPMFTKKQMMYIYSFYKSFLTKLDAINGDYAAKCDNETENPIFILNSDGNKYMMNHKNDESTCFDDETKTYLNALQETFNRETSADDATVQTAVQDNTGYFLLTEGYVKYTFPVKAGKTYFLFGDRTKIGLSGFIFNPTTSEETATTLTLAGSPSGTENSTAISNANGKTVKATINRSFTKGYWYSLVLPFSVSTMQLHKALCNGASNMTNSGFYEHGLKGSEATDLNNEKSLKDVQILYFDGIDTENRTLNLVRHFHYIIPAGTPVFVRGNDSFTANIIEFDNVTVEATEVNPVVIGQYQFTGSYDKWTANKYDFVMMNPGANNSVTSKGQIMQLTSADTYALNAMDATIRTIDAVEGAKLSLSVNGFGDDSTTGIVEIDADTLPKGAVSDNKAIYNLSGQVVGHGLELYTLPKGVYITAGKKYVVR